MQGQEIARLCDLDINLLLERWIDKKLVLVDGVGAREFATNDGLAVQLLPELVKKGYVPTLQWDQMTRKWKMHIAPIPGRGHKKMIYIMSSNTMAGAITMGILQLEEVRQLNK